MLNRVNSQIQTRAVKIDVMKMAYFQFKFIFNMVNVASFKMRTL